MSGGPDSLALLVLAVDAGCDVSAHHVDHGLRPGSHLEAEVVAAAAERLRVPFFAISAEVAPGPNLEARARQTRYSVLPPGALTGHTADDQAETMLLNLMRGAGLAGLAGMRDDRRPLLQLRRRDTEQICEEMGFEVVRDPSNADPRFRRNRVRHELIPLIDDIAQRDSTPVLARQARLLADDSDLLDSMAGDIDPTDVKALSGAPLPIARRAVREWLRSGGHPPDLAAVERVLEVARGGSLACEVAGVGRISRSVGRLSLEPL